MANALMQWLARAANEECQMTPQADGSLTISPPDSNGQYEVPRPPMTEKEKVDNFQKGRCEIPGCRFTTTIYGDLSTHVECHQMDSGKPCSGPRCTAKTKRRCARCKAVFYCTVTCQQSHWDEGHKAVCKPVAEAECKPPAEAE